MGRLRAALRRGRTPGLGPEDGFTLVEVMVAMLILVIVSTATVAIMITSIKTVRQSGDRVQAASIARSEIERLRVLGAAAIPIGQSLPTGYETTGFTVATTANWVGIDQDTNPCESASGAGPGQAYMRVHVEVSGGELTGPQSLDALVPPLDDVPASLTGSVTAWVRDQQVSPQPVAGVLVTATSTAVGATTQTATTGFDGCVFFTQLVPGDWTVSIGVAEPYMVKPGTLSSYAVTGLTPAQNVPVSFFYARSTSITFAAASAKYPILTGVPFTGSFGSWTGTVPSTMPANDFTVPPTGGSLLWPDPSGYTGRLGCSDGGTTLVPVEPGITSVATLSTRAIEIVGPADATVTVKHAAEAAAPCNAALSLAAGTLVVPPAQAPGPLGRLRVSVPFGTWTFAVPGRDGVQVALSASTPSPCSVYWPQVEATPTPTPTPEPEPEPEPTETPTPTPSPTNAAITPEYPPCG